MSTASYIYQLVYAYTALQKQYSRLFVNKYPFRQTHNSSIATVRSHIDGQINGNDDPIDIDKIKWYFEL